MYLESKLLDFMKKRGFVSVEKYYETDNKDPRFGRRKFWQRAIIKNRDGHIRRVFFLDTEFRWRFS